MYLFPEKQQNNYTPEETFFFFFFSLSFSLSFSLADVDVFFTFSFFFSAFGFFFLSFLATSSSVTFLNSNKEKSMNCCVYLAVFNTFLYNKKRKTIGILSFLTVWCKRSINTIFSGRKAVFDHFQNKGWGKWGWWQIHPPPQPSMGQWIPILVIILNNNPSLLKLRRCMQDNAHGYLRNWTLTKSVEFHISNFPQIFLFLGSLNLQRVTMTSKVQRVVLDMLHIKNINFTWVYLKHYVARLWKLWCDHSKIIQDLRSFDPKITWF